MNKKIITLVVLSWLWFLTLFMVAVAHSETVDTLSFMLPKDYSYGLHGATSWGNDSMWSWFKSGNSLWTVKGRFNRGLYAKHTWDASYVYLAEDRTCGPGCSRKFIGYKRAKRQMLLGEKIYAKHRLIQYDKDCKVVADYWRTVPTVLERRAYMNHGGDVKIANTIVFNIILSRRGGEKVYYAKGWGAVKWEHYRDGVILDWSIKNLKASNPLKPDLTQGCP